MFSLEQVKKDHPRKLVKQHTMSFSMQSLYQHVTSKLSMFCFILQEKALPFGRDEGPYGLIVVPSVSITCVQLLQTDEV